MYTKHDVLAISIHASREGSDKNGDTVMYIDGISIHASREGSDSAYRTADTIISLFQSTLPAREATMEAKWKQWVTPISIHASRGGSDT